LIVTEKSHWPGNWYGKFNRLLQWLPHFCREAA
jgi:hypothetical protein